MYSPKEKLSHYNEIKAEQHKDVDLALLRSKNPQTKCSAGSKATEILYELLDYATREDIIANRRGGGPSNDDKKTVAQAKAEIKELIASIEGKTYDEACVIKHDADQLIVGFIKNEKDKKALSEQLNSAFGVVPVPENEDTEGSEDKDLLAPESSINGEGEGDLAPAGEEKPEGSVEQTEEQKKTQE